jgi:hypothetical protein
MKKTKVFLLVCAGLIACATITSVVFAQSETCTADVSGTAGYCMRIASGGTTTGFYCDANGSSGIRCNH